MRIIPNAILLIFSLLIVPMVSFYFGVRLDPNAIQALKTLLVIAGLAIGLCFAAGELTGNVSQTDKLWSLMPIVYTWTVTCLGSFSPRLVLMSLLVTAWGLRLTYNFAMKGGYHWKIWQGKEDYRWQVLREKPEFQSRWRWTAFNLFFIAGYQHLLVLLITLPIVIALNFNMVPLGMLDYVAAIALLIFIIYEAIADKQQWEFQVKKHAASQGDMELHPELAKGFLDRGLWAWSRHPNYFAEQSIWICFYLFSVTASGQWINWSILGSLLLILLFRGSSTFSEEITASKYPGYAEYQHRVARFLPLPLCWPSTSTRNRTEDR
ncbi:MAG: DUF1295 domain-containing protein [Planctomycetota bacterium]